MVTLGDFCVVQENSHDMIFMAIEGSLFNSAIFHCAESESIRGAAEIVEPL